MGCGQSQKTLDFSLAQTSDLGLGSTLGSVLGWGLGLGIINMTSNVYDLHMNIICICPDGISYQFYIWLIILMWIACLLGFSLTGINTIYARNNQSSWIEEEAFVWGAIRGLTDVSQLCLK